MIRTTGVIAGSYFKDIEDQVLPGTIVAWTGGIGSIPLGWLVCDGENGTPDLSNNIFVRGSSSSGATGGGSHSHSIGSASNHQHSLSTETAHRHVPDITQPGNQCYELSNQWHTTFSGRHSHPTGGTNAGAHDHSSGSSTVVPEYYGVIFIIREDE